MKLKDFIFTKVFIKQLFIAIGITIVLVWAIIFSLNFYTHHGEYVLVPNFNGLKAGALEAYAKEHEVRFEVVDSVYNDTAPKGTVVNQNPLPTFKVKKERVIYLTMNAILPEQVKMPNLVDMSLRQATATLESYGFKLGRIEYLPHFAKNAVLFQRYRGRDIKGGSLIQRGSVIDLALGSGTGGEKIIVPYVVGLSRDSAIAKLKVFALNVGGMFYDKANLSSADSARGIVYKQSPNPSLSERISMGDFVDLYLTFDRDKIRIDSSLTRISKKMDTLRR